MIFCGFGATRFFGTTLKNIEDFVNIANSFHEMLIARGKDIEGSDDVYIECCKLGFLLTSDSDNKEKAEARLAHALVKMAGAQPK